MKTPEFKRQSDPNDKEAQAKYRQQLIDSFGLKKKSSEITDEDLKNYIDFGGTEEEFNELLKPKSEFGESELEYKSPMFFTGFQNKGGEILAEFLVDGSLVYFDNKRCRLALYNLAKQIDQSLGDKDFKTSLKITINSVRAALKEWPEEKQRKGNSNKNDSGISKKE